MRENGKERAQSVSDGDGRGRGDGDGGESVRVSEGVGASFSFGCGEGKQATAALKTDSRREERRLVSVSYKEKLLAPGGLGFLVSHAEEDDIVSGWKGFFANMNTEQENGGKVDKVQRNEEDGDDVTESQYLVLTMTEQQYTAWCRPWMNSLIIKVLGMSVPKHVLFDRVRRMWKPQQPLKVVPLSNEYYVVSFSSKEDRDYAYHEEPWMIDDHYILVQRWRPNFNPWKADCQRRIAVWVRIPDLPMEFCTVESLGIIGNMIGKIIKIDRSISIYDKGEFARICVEVDLHKPLLPAFTIFGENRQLVYEGLHLVCFECGRYGHVMERCPDKVEAHATMGVVVEPSGCSNQETRPVLGEDVRGKNAKCMGVGGVEETQVKSGGGSNKYMGARSSEGLEVPNLQSAGRGWTSSVAGHIGAPPAILCSGAGQPRPDQGAHLGPQMILRREMRRSDPIRREERGLDGLDGKKSNGILKGVGPIKHEWIAVGSKRKISEKPRVFGTENKTNGKPRSHAIAPSAKDIKNMEIKNNFSILQEPTHSEDNLMQEVVPTDVHLLSGSTSLLQTVQEPLLEGIKNEGDTTDGMKDDVMTTDVQAQQSSPSVVLTSQHGSGLAPKISPSYL
ncbi:hypothetical protein K1719_021064 [Acacia pycnantha]|nr:hypothetical protein K1719_021064 [Acacia pycnantha]